MCRTGDSCVIYIHLHRVADGVGAGDGAVVGATNRAEKQAISTTRYGMNMCHPSCM